MTEPRHAVIDGDAFKYAAAYVGEKKSVVAHHKTEGWTQAAKSRTEFWGHWKKRAGGWLAEHNAGRESPYHPDEFEIEDVSVPEPIANVLHTAKVMIDDAILASKADTYEMYMGKGDSWRVEASTLQKYKGDRDDLVKPYHLDEVAGYIERRYNAEIITGLEADDVVNIRCYRQANNFAMGEDKDYWGCPINNFDINRMHRGIVNCNKFGHLFIDTDKSKTVRGEGRMHFYYQVISEDAVDCYKASYHSDIEWGSKSAYKALMECTNDKEALTEMVKVFKHLYPEPKTVKGWRGDDINIDWLYVMQEMWTMAHMKRTYTEPVIDVRSVLERVGVDF